ncbi:MAG: ASKHA domain-containing protein [Acidiferrobacterales bacterium]|nr:ASKHA domain-containing protein [Acidiferrobacterales bacterium]
MTQNTDSMVVFTPSGRRGRFPKGTTILQAARSLGVDLDSVCGGRAMCGRCQIELSTGAFAKHGVESRTEHLSSLSAVETEYAKSHELRNGRRLGCSVQILGDVVIDVPPESQVHRQVVRKRAEVHAINLNPVVRMYYVEVQEPNMHDPSGDLQRLKDALEFDWRLENLSCDLKQIQQLQSALREGEWKVTAAVHDGSQIVAVWPGFRDQAYGLAIDVGSTTIAAHLCELSSGQVVESAGVMNPQIRFGEDLMSRVSYLMMNPGHEKEMTDEVRRAIQKLSENVAQAHGIEVEDILDLVFVGNPVMQHLLLGISPIELGGAPFALATDESVSIWANELDLSLHPNARAFILPCIAGHVGADAAGMVLSEQPYLSQDNMLLVDVGTNAEIVLGNCNRLVAASSPTGPAFEGAQISSGQRAAPGAIERLRIDKETLVPKFKVIGCDLWSTQEGFEDGIRDFGVTGICGSGIIEAIAEMYLAGVIDSDGVIQGGLSARSERIIADGRTFSYVIQDTAPRVVITQNDVRAIQLAKAALYAGIRLLMDRLALEQVDVIRLAGAFGSHVDVKYAMVLGMIPDCDLSQVTSAGNAAGTGARIALLDRNSRSEIRQVVRNIEKVETAVEPSFQTYFVEAMAIPHRSASFPQLGKVVDLPKSAGSSDHQSGQRRRRRRAANREG